MLLEWLVICTNADTAMLVVSCFVFFELFRHICSTCWLYKHYYKKTITCTCMAFSTVIPSIAGHTIRCVLGWSVIYIMSTHQLYKTCFSFLRFSQHCIFGICSVRKKPKQENYKRYSHEIFNSCSLYFRTYNKVVLNIVRLYGVLESNGNEKKCLATI